MMMKMGECQNNDVTEMYVECSTKMCRVLHSTRCVGGKSGRPPPPPVSLGRPVGHKAAPRRKSRGIATSAVIFDA